MRRLLNDGSIFRNADGVMYKRVIGRHVGLGKYKGGKKGCLAKTTDVKL